MARMKVEKNISYDDVKNLYYVNMDYGKNELGKRVKATKTFKSKAEARKALKEFEADKTKGTLVVPTSETISMWLDYWLENIKSRNCEETTLYGYRNMINNHIKPVIGEIPLQKLSAKDINKYFTLLEVDKNLSINTIRKHYDLLKDSLQKAEDEERISKSPVNKIEPPKPVLREKNFYSPEQLQQLFSFVEGDRMEVVVKLAGYLGLRREEIAGLKWCHVEFESSRLSIVEARTQAGKSVVEKGTKNATSHRTLTMPEEVKDVLRRVKSKQEEYKEQLGVAYIDSGYVMTWEDGRPYRPNYLSELFKQIIDRNDLPPLRLHDLRHTFASIANSIGVSMFDIGKALGHSNVGTTGKIYTHLFDKTQESTINNVAKAIKAKV